MDDPRGSDEDNPETLRAVVRAYIHKRAPIATTHHTVDAAAARYDTALWSGLSRELGLPGLTIPERWGGAGLSAVELSLVLEELARGLVMTPFLSVALAVEAFVASGDEDLCADVLRSVADGSTTLALALSTDAGYWAAERVSVEARPDGSGGWRLTGSIAVIIDGYSADQIVVAARSERDLELYLVDGNDTTVERSLEVGIDLTREMARVRLHGSPARRLQSQLASGRLVEHLRDRALVAYVAEMTGIASRCLEMAVDYAKTREQFGRPIGSFQAVKQKCADMLVATESMHAASWSISRLAATESSDLPLAAAVAKAYASDRCYRVAADNIQIHGGIGYTWEHDAHLYFRRAKALQLLGGTAPEHRTWIATQIGL